MLISSSPLRHIRQNKTERVEKWAVADAPKGVLGGLGVRVAVPVEVAGEEVAPGPVLQHL